MRFPLARLTRNWQLKLAAVTLAVLLWVVVSAEQLTTQWIRGVPVEVVMRDPDYVATGRPIPREVDVRFTGPGRELWELALDRPVLVLPISDVEGDDQVFLLDPQMVRVPNGLAVRALDVRPSSVRVPLQRIATREVPVRLRMGPGYGERYVLADTPTVQPGFVRVTGPAGRVARITEVHTEPLTFTGGDTVFSRVLRIPADTLPGVRLSTSAVRVTGRMDPIVERIFPGVSIAPLPDAEVVPERVEVRLQGPARLVRGLDRTGIRAVVPTDSVPPLLPAEGALVPVSVFGLPPGVSARVNPPRVRVSPPGAPGELLPEGGPASPDTLPRVVGRTP